MTEKIKEKMRTNPFFIFIPPIRPASNTVRMNNYNKLQRKKSSPFAETPYFRLTPTFGRLVPYKKIYNFRGTLSHSLPRSVFEKTPLGSLKNFFRFLKAKPDNLVGVSCRDFVPPEKAWPFQVVQVGGIAENPRAFGRCLPPCTRAQNTHRGDGDRSP